MLVEIFNMSKTFGIDLSSILQTSLHLAIKFLCCKIANVLRAPFYYVFSVVLINWSKGVVKQ